MKIIITGFAVAFITTGLLTAGFLRFASSIPTDVNDLETKTDAIVVLTGGSERLKTGISLLEKGLAKKLFVSGVDKRVKIKTLLKSVNISSKNIGNNIILGYNARNTHENAIETAGWIKGQGFKSLRLVTGAYHMHRSMLEFSYAMPDIKAIPHPVFPENVKHHEWWLWPGSTILIATEYTKHLAAAVLQELQYNNETGFEK